MNFIMETGKKMYLKKIIRRIFFSIFFTSFFIFQGCVPSKIKVSSIPEIKDKEYILFKADIPCKIKGTMYQSKLFLQDLETKEEIQLTFSPEDNEYLSPSPWSPDGNKILFMSSQFAIKGEIGEKDGIYIMDIKKKRIFRIRGADAIDFSFSPDEKKFLFCSDKDCLNKGNADIYIMDADGKNEKRLTFTPNSSEDYPSFSPDGKKVIFVLNDFKDERNDGIYTLNLDNGSIQRLTDNWLDGEPIYSPDGKNIAFNSKREGDKKGKIYIMDANGKNIERLTSDDPYRSEEKPSFSPDGKKIVFKGLCFTTPERKEIIHDLFIADLETRNVERLTFSPKRFEWNPSFRPRPKAIK